MGAVAMRTASGLVRRIRPYPVDDNGAITWPTPIHRRYVRRVILTANDRPAGMAFGHRFPDGRHANTIANRNCWQCIVEAELTFLQTMWAASLNLPACPPRRRRHSR
jgi:hypothetical protein